MSTVPAGDIEALVTLFRESGWREMHLQAEGVELFLSKDSAAQLPRTALAAPAIPAAPAAPVAAPAAAPPAPAAPAPATAVPDNCIVVRAPSLGTFYRAPKPGAPAFCEVGQRVEADSQLCLIEVMKLFTTVRAGTAGTIREICVPDGEMVEFDQPLFVIESHG